MPANGVCAVIVTFHPRAEDFDNLGGVRLQVEQMVVVDNGSDGEQLCRLREASRQLNFVLLENGQNLGIAAALNAGVRWAQANGSQWVALFDQDSAATEGFIEHMLADFAFFAARRNILLLVPRYRDPESGVERECPMDADGGPFVTITSGSFLPMRAFDTCGYFKEELFIYTVDDEYSLRLRSRGYFKEELFIYTVDDEYSLRLRSRGYSIALSPHVVLLHVAGVPSYCRIFGRPWFQTTNYRPGVRYYISRNRVWMSRMYGARYPRWVRGAFRASLIDLCKLSIAEDARLDKMRMVFLGFRDGLLGRMGRTVTL